MIFNNIFLFALMLVNLGYGLKPDNPLWMINMLAGLVCVISGIRLQLLIIKKKRLNAKRVEL